MSLHPPEEDKRQITGLHWFCFNVQRCALQLNFTLVLLLSWRGGEDDCFPVFTVTMYVCVCVLIYTKTGRPSMFSCRGVCSQRHCVSLSSYSGQQCWFLGPAQWRMPVTATPVHLIDTCLASHDCEAWLWKGLSHVGHITELTELQMAQCLSLLGRVPLW